MNLGFVTNLSYFYIGCLRRVGQFHDLGLAVCVCDFVQFVLVNASCNAAIGNAFSVLSNPEKRQRYDQFGTEEETTPVTSHRHYHNGSGYYEFDYTRGFEG
jgi:hypothetical protein